VTDKGLENWPREPRKNERTHDIILTASLTENRTLLSDKLNKYVFRVTPRANKIQIKNAIEKLFQKKVID